MLPVSCHRTRARESGADAVCVFFILSCVVGLASREPMTAKLLQRPMCGYVEEKIMVWFEVDTAYLLTKRTVHAYQVLLSVLYCFMCHAKYNQLCY